MKKKTMMMMDEDVRMDEAAPASAAAIAIADQALHQPEERKKER